jgi:hypothetical protein
VSVIESAYRSDPAAARPDLISALLALAETQSSEDEQWRTLNRALRIDAGQPLLREKQTAILRRWAARALEEGDYQVALNAFEQLGDEAGIAAVRRKMRGRSLVARLPRFSKSNSA